MNRQAFRSVCSRANPELGLSTSTPKSFFRNFSTTQWVAEENSNPKPAPPPRPSTARQRGRAAASQINSFAKPRPQTNSSATGAAGPGATGQGQPKVLDIRSLPAGLARGRGGFLRGRGGAARGRGGAPGATSTRPTGGANRFSGANRGGASARGGRGGNRGGKPKRAGDDKKKARDAPSAGGKRVDPFDIMDTAEQEFDNAMRFGTTTTYTPALDAGALLEFAPAVPTSASGRRATVLQNLSTLGASEQVGVPRGLTVGDQAAQLSKSGLRYFADTQAKAATEGYLKGQETEETKTEGAVIQPVEESVRNFITETAVKGKHEAPKYATNWQGVMRSTFLRSESYTQKAIDGFEGKVAALVGKAETAKPKAKAKKA